MLLSVVIPCFNERATLLAMVDAIYASVALGLSQHQAVEVEVIVVDDGSTDGSSDLLVQALSKHPSLRLFKRQKNGGKGAALRDGFAQAKGELILIQDADLEYDPLDYPALLAPILSGKADLVLGSRFLGPSRRAPQLFHYLGNRVLSLLHGLHTGLYLTDVHTCYKLFRRRWVMDLELESNDFCIDQELVFRAAQGGLRIVEVAVSYAPRGYAEGKKLRLLDGVHALWSLRPFGPWR